MNVVSVGSAAEKGDMLGMSAINVEIGPGGPKISAPKAKVAIFSMKASGNQATVRMESTYDNSDSARKVADNAKKNMEAQKGKNTDGATFDISQSGSTVTLTATGPINKNKGGFPGFPFGGGMK
jgi:hypothetical protein